MHNDLRFNSSKCELLTPKHQPIKFDYKVSNNPIGRATTSKALGVIVDKDFQWRQC